MNNFLTWWAIFGDHTRAIGKCLATIGAISVEIGKVAAAHTAAVVTVHVQFVPRATIVSVRTVATNGG